MGPSGAAGDPGSTEGRVGQLRALIGTSVTGAPDHVERTDILDFAQAIRWPADPLAVYTDEAVARARHGGFVTPPTYPGRLARVRGFSLPMPVPAWWPPLPGILANVEVEQVLPIRAGDAITTTATIVGVARQEVAGGTLVGIVRDFELINQRSERVGRTRRTIAKFLDGPLADRTDLPDGIGGIPAPTIAQLAAPDVPPFERDVTLLELNRFAGANREYGLYHMDAEYARSLGIPGPLVLEHLKLAYLGNLLEDWLGEGGRIHRLAASFLALDTTPVTLTARGAVLGPSPGLAGGIDVAVWIQDGDGRVGTVGRATVSGRS